MQNPYLMLSLLELKNIIRQSMATSSTKELLDTFTSIKNGSGSNPAPSETDLVFDDIPDALRPLAEALYGLVSVTDGPNEKEKSQPVAAFPLRH